MDYKYREAVSYALKYAINPNDKYVYFENDDCTNFVSQCLRAGGAKNHFHPTHPWWYVNNKASICWSVAESLYWYILVSSKEGKLGIKAVTTYLNGDNNFNNSIPIQLGDIIQYRNNKGKVYHSAIVTNFVSTAKFKEPQISQHTYNKVNTTWRKNANQTIFHHITSI